MLKQVVMIVVFAAHVDYIGAFTPKFLAPSQYNTVVQHGMTHALLSNVSSMHSCSNLQKAKRMFLQMSANDIYNAGGSFEDDEDEYDKDEDEEEELSIYEEFASSEFLPEEEGAVGKLARSFGEKPVDWGGEYDTLRTRAEEAKQGVGPSRALFRIMTAETPNEAIMNFVSGASPEVVTAMSSAVTSLLGGLTNPTGGVETIIKANGEKLGSLCFQLQMTGYMFRNAEYVLAIRDLMNIRGSATLDDYKEAFDDLDKDGSGYIESREIEELLRNVYEDELPAFEVETFLQFFDSNNDGKISWEEFEKGLGVVADKTIAKKRKSANINNNFALSGIDEDEVEDEDDLLEEPTVSGMIQIEMKNGIVIEVEAKEYIQELKREAEALKSALSREKGPSGGNMSGPLQPSSPMMDAQKDSGGGITAYIASLQGDMESLTKGISPEVVEAMKMLVDFVLEPSKQGKQRGPDELVEMEIPGSALQQLALWQLVLGYKLREAEATGEYKKMLE